MKSLYQVIISKPYRRLLEPKSNSPFDWVNPLCILTLAVIGILFIYSAQFTAGGGAWRMQILWVIVGAVAYAVVSAIDYNFWLAQAHWLYLAGIGALLLVMTPLGVEMMGARRWINLKVIYFQPTEAAKIGTLIMAASILARSRLGTLRDSLSVLVLVSGVFLLPILLIFLQPDLGSALVFPPMLFALLYVSRFSRRFFLSVFILFALLLGVVAVDVNGFARHLSANEAARAEGRAVTAYQDHSLLPLRDYQRVRILTFVAPAVIDPSGTGASWNSNQAKISAATGGLTGKGFLQGTQAQLGYLPKAVAHNDFIYSVIAEETGFLGSALVITLFGVLVANGLRIAGLSKDRFGMQLAVGVSVLFLVHFFINIGMTVGITPITGLPLPFLSYGGSFVLSCFILQGLVQSVYRHRRQYA